MTDEKKKFKIPDIHHYIIIIVITIFIIYIAVVITNITPTTPVTMPTVITVVHSLYLVQSLATGYSRFVGLSITKIIFLFRHMLHMLEICVNHILKVYTSHYTTETLIHQSPLENIQTSFVV